VKKPGHRSHARIYRLLAHVYARQYTVIKVGEISKKAMKQQTHKHHKMLPKLLLVCAVLLLVTTASVVVAQENSRLDISSIDVSGFPDVVFNVIASDSTSTHLADLNGLAVNEDGSAVTGVSVDTVPVGTELIFVIDSNTNILARDDSGGPTRLEKVRDSIVAYAQQYMDDTQLDLVTIIVPGAGGGSVLLDNTTFPNAVINEINFYDPELSDPTPLNNMLSMALEKAATNHDRGKFQSIVLFSDAGNLDQQLDYDVLVSQAQELNVAIFGVILGAIADNNEINNITRLSEPTRGNYAHMGELSVVDPIYSLIQAHQSQFQIQYRSSASTSGSHSISVNLGGVSGEQQYELEISPAQVNLAIDNSQPIRRVLPTPDSPLTAAEPTMQPIAAVVEWPDGHPRGVSSAALLVNGVPLQSISDPEIGPDNIVVVDWDISNLDEGSYGLSIQVTDELNLQSQSEALPLEVIVEGAAAEPTEPEIQPTIATETVAPTEPENLLDSLGLVGIVLGVLALLVALAVLIFAISVVRRRRPSTEAAAPMAAAQPAQFQQEADYGHEATQVMMPAFAAHQGAIGYLEPLENAPAHTDNIPITSGNMAIGRDPKLVQIQFAHKSVSRLHARIIEKGGVFQLYDEGSASGTYINYEQISLQPQRLNDNDDIHFGQVHVRFHVTGSVDDSDSTQVMPSPMQPGRPQQPAPAVDDDMSTQPFMPNQPPGPGGGYVQPPASGDDDEDDLSTQPYMPHSPR